MSFFTWCIYHSIFSVLLVWTDCVNSTKFWVIIKLSKTMSKSHWLWLFMRMCRFPRNTYICIGVIYMKYAHGHMFHSSLFWKICYAGPTTYSAWSSLKIIRLTEVLTNLLMWSMTWLFLKFGKNFTFQNWYFV